MAALRTWLLQGTIVLVVIFGALLATAYVVGGVRLDERYEIETVPLALPDDSATLAQGAHLARIHGCTDCHAEDLSGRVIMDEQPFRVVASNLTSGEGGIGDDYSVADFDRAIRHGVRPDGRPLIVMPSAAFHSMSDADAAALIAWIRQVPPVDHELPETQVRLLGRMMASFALDPAAEVREGRPGPGSGVPRKAPTAGYGGYLASMTCAYCHGPDLRGAEPPVPGSPVAPDLVALVEDWTRDEFIETLRTGTTPDGRELDPEFMPYALTQQMDAVELEALWAFLQRQSRR